MTPNIETVTEPLRDLWKNANDQGRSLWKNATDQTERWNRELRQRSERLLKEASQRSQELLDQAREATLSTAWSLEQSLLEGVEKALDQAAERAPELALLDQARERLHTWKQEARRWAAAHGAVALPVPGYAELNARQAVAAAKGLDAEQKALLLAWERAHKNRKTVIRALEA